MINFFRNIVIVNYYYKHLPGVGVCDAEEVRLVFVITGDLVCRN